MFGCPGLAAAHRPSLAVENGGATFLLWCLGSSFGGFSCRSPALGALAEETGAYGLSSCGAWT